jgi:hypothetical protein
MAKAKAKRRGATSADGIEVGHQAPLKLSEDERDEARAKRHPMFPVPARGWHDAPASPDADDRLSTVSRAQYHPRPRKPEAFFHEPGGLHCLPHI